MLHYLDKVRVKEKLETKIIAPGHQAAVFFSGHPAIVIGQKKAMSYVCWFKESMGYTEPVCEAIPEAELELLERGIPPKNPRLVLDAGTLD